MPAGASYQPCPICVCLCRIAPVQEMVRLAEYFKERSAAKRQGAVASVWCRTYLPVANGALA